MEWRPAQRYIEAPGTHSKDKATGLGIVEQPLREVKRVPEKRHLRQVSSKEEASDRPQGPQTVHRENGLRAVDQPAQEVDISKEFNRRVRVPDMTAQRNGLRCRSMGDKNYRHPEYDRNFHQIGGLVVGSTFQRGHHKKTESRNNTQVVIAQENLVRTPPKYRGNHPNHKKTESPDNTQVVIAQEENLDRTEGRSWEEWKCYQREERRREQAAAEVAELTRNWEASTLKDLDDTYEDPDSGDDEATQMPQEDGKK